MEDHLPQIKKITYDLSRFQKPTTKATSERAELIERFVIRLNNSRKAAGYKPLGAGFYASKMSHIATGELHFFYKKLDQSDNFSALWWHYCKPKKKMTIYCTGCQKDVEPRLTDGKEIYPHREDLASLPFWKCDTCQNYVGCHHKTKDKTKPLGVIPTKELMNARKHIHELLDPMCKGIPLKRKKLYKKLSKRLGYEYHTDEIRTIEEARRVYQVLQGYKLRNIEKK